MDQTEYLRKLAAARDRIQGHEDAARDERQAVYALIVSRPEGVTKAEIHRVSGVSRPTIDSLLKTGRATP